jgi:hypothetical protein
LRTFYLFSTYHSEAFIAGLWAMRKKLPIQIKGIIFQSSGDGKGPPDGVSYIFLRSKIMQDMIHVF